MPKFRSLPVSDHFAEIALLGIIALGVIFLAYQAIETNSAGEASAWTAVLMAIIGAIKERWLQRSVDQMGSYVAQSSPGGEPLETKVVNDETDPVPTTPARKR